MWGGSFLGHILALLTIVVCNSAFGTDSASSADDSEFIQRFKRVVRDHVMEQGYSDAESESVIDMVFGWKDLLDRVVILDLKREIDSARRESTGGTISQVQFSQKEEEIAIRLAVRIRYEIGEEDKADDLSTLLDLVNSRTGTCLSLTQLYDVLANSLGITVRPIKVAEPTGGPLPLGIRHLACLVYLSDNRSVVVDMAYDLLSDGFVLEDKFEEKDGVWELREKKNHDRIHPRFRILSKNEWSAIIDHCIACKLDEEKKYSEALSRDSKSIGECASFADAYMGRSLTHWKLHHVQEAFADASKAIELDGNDASYYVNRAGYHYYLGDFDQSISDLAKAIELAPASSSPYFVRAKVYFKKKAFETSLADLERAIALSPDDAAAYFLRAKVHGQLHDYTNAEKDFQKAEELEPQLREKITVARRSMTRPKE
jgi:tetratricopeptide (TPR) repeat protein